MTSTGTPQRVRVARADSCTWAPSQRLSLLLCKLQLALNQLKLQVCNCKTTQEYLSSLPDFLLQLTNSDICVKCRAYDRAAYKLRGPRSALNFPEADYSVDSFIQVSKITPCSCSSCSD